ncbi:hypothetical protein Anas_12894 [Armadillidium nasatum]|uniref:Uncharacterized protein n=1 Tax=Armadillidium nasatum TaxID=96803 RepID=A0A5N5TA28_9CRUS|nr:hypothetical protein Anas_12894 [Armadillidium nasatum]
MEFVKKYLRGQKRKNANKISSNPVRKYLQKIDPYLLFSCV